MPWRSTSRASFKLYGWCMRIRGVELGGAVTNLPVHTFPTDDGGVAMKCPTEIAIDDRREKELADLGLMPLLHRKNTDIAAFIGAQSLQKPEEYDDPDATANANLSARLPYLFAVCRFAHYLKSIVRDKIGSFKEREDMQKWLQKWIIELRRRQPGHLVRDGQGAPPTARGRGRGRIGRGQSRLLQCPLLPAAALPARRRECQPAAGIQAAVGEGGLRSLTEFTTNRQQHSGDHAARGKAMAVDMFLKIDGADRRVAGRRACGRDRRARLELGACRNPARAHIGGGGGAGKVSVQDLSVTKYVDKASPT